MSREFLFSHGFEADPFEFTNADEEPELERYFVPPPYFPAVYGDPARPKSTVVLAPRGGGKSAQRRMIEVRADAGTDVLIVPYSDFSFVTKAGAVPVEAHLEEICRRLVFALLAHVGLNPDDGALLLAHERELLLKASRSLLGGVTQAQMEIAMRGLRTPGERLIEQGKRAGRPIRAVIAGAASAATGVEIRPEDLELAAKPSPPEDGWRETFRGLVNLAGYLKYSSVYVLVDKVDERPFTTQDAHAAFALVRELLLDLGLLEEPSVAFKFFLWDQIETDLTDAGFRQDRITKHRLRWSFEELEQMLRERVRAYSAGRVESMNALACEDVSVDLDKLLAMLAQGSPRDMIRLGARIIAEATREDANPDCVQESAVWAATRGFAQERAEELFPYVGELRRVGRPTFSMSELASDLLRVHENSARRKVQVWQSTGLVAKVGEVTRGRGGGRPQYLYGVTDPRLLIAMLPTTGVQEILGNYVLVCPECGLLVLDDRRELQCPHCEHAFGLSGAPTLLDTCRRV